MDCNLTSEVVHHHIGHRDQHWYNGSGEYKVHKGYEYQEAGVIGSHLGGGLQWQGMGRQSSASSQSSSEER